MFQQMWKTSRCPATTIPSVRVSSRQSTLFAEIPIACVCTSRPTITPSAPAVTLENWLSKVLKKKLKTITIFTSKLFLKNTLFLLFSCSGRATLRVRRGLQDRQVVLRRVEAVRVRREPGGVDRRSALLGSAGSGLQGRPILVRGRKTVLADLRQLHMREWTVPVQRGPQDAREEVLESDR